MTSEGTSLPTATRQTSDSADRGTRNCPAKHGMYRAHAHHAQGRGEPRENSQVGRSVPAPRGCNSHREGALPLPVSSVLDTGGHCNLTAASTRPNKTNPSKRAVSNLGAGGTPSVASSLSTERSGSMISPRCSGRHCKVSKSCETDN